MIQKLRGKIQEISGYLTFIKDCQVVFKDPHGQRVLRYLMKKGCVTSPVGVVGDRDESLRNEGAQRLVLSILRATYRDPSEIEQQLEEEASNI